jgi:hypothetical protein
MSRPRDARKEVEQFARDVDLLLADQPVVDTCDDSYKADLGLAHLLSQGCFVPDPHFKCRLRNQLLNKLGERKESKTMSPMKVFRSLVRPVLVASLSAGIVLGAALAISPDARAAAQEMWVRFVEVDSPWALLPRGEGQPQIERGADSTTALPLPSAAGDDGTGGANAGRAVVDAPEPPSGLESGAEGLPVPGVQPTRDLISLEEAQARLDFVIGVPSVLPDGYTFRGVVPQPELPTNPPDLGIAPPDDLPEIEQPQIALLVFDNAEGEVLILAERFLTDPAPVKVPLPAGPGGVQDVTVNGQSGQYVAGRWTEDGWVADGSYQLHWQSEDGILYDLTSATLDLEALLPVAESIQ